MATSRAQAVLPRIRKYAERNESGCWIWTAKIDADGYGHISVDGRDQLAHRAAYEVLVGPIPDGLVLDHLCRVRACVSPDHLEPVTQLENQARGERSHLKRFCVHGHEYTPENTYLNPRGFRACRECLRFYQRRRQARLRAERMGATAC